tara:strand:- start:1967 stop:2215 length:249 start_codon:yes stop_codon:yes gene_type:complete
LSDVDRFQNFTKTNEITNPRSAQNNKISYHLFKNNIDGRKKLSNAKTYALVTKLLKLNGRKKIVLPSNNSKIRKAIPITIQV